MVEGPVGIGRTRLLKATATKAAERGLTVAYGRAGGSGQPTPVHTLIDFLRHVLATEAEFGDLSRLDDNPFWLTERLGELLEYAARRRPMLIVVDDAQRADEVNGLTLQGLVQSLVSSPVLWLLARRPIPAHSLTQHAISSLIDHTAVRLRLGPLDSDAVATLCTCVLGAKPDSSVLRWAARCGGNPGLLTGLLNALLEAGQVVVVDGTASLLADRLPERALATVDRLMGELPPTVRRLLAHGGRIGRTFTVEQVAASLNEPPPELSASVDEAVHAGLMRRNGTQLAFANEVLGEALGHLDGSVPRAEPHPHRRLRAAASEPVPAPRPNTDAPAETRSVPARTLRPAVDEDSALAHAVPALTLQPGGTRRTIAPALCLLATTGRSAEARRLAAVVSRTGLDGAEARLLSLPTTGTRDDDCPETTLHTPHRTAARRHLRDVGAAGWAGDARAGGGESLVVGPRASTDNTGAPTGDEVFTVLRRPAHPRERPLWTWLARALVATGRFDEAATLCAAIRQDSQTRGGAWREALWHGHRAELLLAAGRLDDAHAEAQTGLSLTDHPSPGDQVVARAVMARISLHLGDMASASEHLRRAERLAEGQAAADKAAFEWALAQFHAASGRPEMAFRTLIDADQRTNPLLLAEAPTAAASLVRWARQAGLGAESEQVTSDARLIAESNPAVAALAGGTEHAEGLLNHDPNALYRAVEHYRLDARPLAMGVALEDAAQEEHNTRNKARAVELLESALHLYEDCGAQRDITRVQKTLRRFGVHHVRALVTDRPKSGWDSLTTAELRVVQAVVEGKTNKEAATMLFLSPHTVDSHLRRVFTKLNINSRVELTKQFIEHDTATPVRQAKPVTR